MFSPLTHTLVEQIKDKKYLHHDYRVHDKFGIVGYLLHSSINTKLVHLNLIKLRVQLFHHLLRFTGNLQNESSYPFSITVWFVFFVCLLGFDMSLNV